MFLISFLDLLYVYVCVGSLVSQQHCTRVGLEEIKGPGGNTCRMIVRMCVSCQVLPYSRYVCVSPQSVCMAIIYE